MKCQRFRFGKKNLHEDGPENAYMPWRKIYLANGSHRLAKTNQKGKFKKNDYDKHF